MLSKRLINSNNAGGGGGCTDIVDNYDPFGGNGVALYQLNGDATDVSGNYNGTASNVTYGAGVFGQAGVFNGSSSFINLGPTNQFQSPQVTISFWIKPTSFSDQMIIANQNGGSFAEGDFFVAVRTDGYIGYEIGISSSIYEAKYCTTTQLQLNAWNNVVLILDSSLGTNISKIYVNSIDQSLSNTYASGGTFSGNLLIGTLQLNLGKRNISGNELWLSSPLDQVRIFNTALTPLEVEALYTEELCICDGTVDTLDILGDGSCIATYQLDGNANDLSGNYNGTPTNVSYGVGEFDLAGVFNGSTSRIQLDGLSGTGNFFCQIQTFTLSIWFKTTTTADSVLFSDYGGQSYNLGFSFLGSTGEISAGTRYSDNLAKTTTSNASNLNDGAWHNVVVTMSGAYGVRNIYIDGQFDNSIALGGSTFNNTREQRVNLASTYSAATNTYSSYFDGSIDQVRIFNKALNSTEVTTLYNETACSIPVPQDVDYSNLDISQATVKQLLYNQDPSVRSNQMGIAPNGRSIVWSGYDLSYVKALGQSFLSVPTNILSYNTGIYTSATNAIDYNNGYRNVQFADNGYVLYFSDLNILTVVYLANPYDVSSYTSFNKYTIDGSRSAFFSQDGSIMYLKYYLTYLADSKIYQYSTSNFVYSTANLVGEFSTDGIFGASFQQRTATITPDGRKIICVGTGADRLDQLDLSTPFDITTASFNNKTLSTTNMWRDPSNVSFSLDGKTMYIGSQQGLASYNITL